MTTDRGTEEALRAAIDGGDHETVTVLADLLEEAGDRRHLGLRLIIAKGWRPREDDPKLLYGTPRKYHFYRMNRPGDMYIRDFRVIYPMFNDAAEQGRRWKPLKDSLSEAYLDLARILVEYDLLDM